MPSCLGYRVEGKDPEGRYAYAKDIIADPHLPCLLQRVTVRANPEWLSCLKTYVLCAPHLDVGGAFDINNINKLEGRFWVRGLPFPKYKAPGAPISVEEHTSMAPRPRRQSQNPPLQKSSAIPALPWPSKPRLRYSPGLAPTTRLNALLNAASDS